MQGARPFVHMRHVIVTALAILLGMCLGALVARTRLRKVSMFSHAVSASHGAAAARLLFGFTLDPLARCTQVHTHFSASYLPVCTPVHKLGAAVTRRFFRICPEYFYPRGEQRSY
jgi:hypothetical protein